MYYNIYFMSSIQNLQILKIQFEINNSKSEEEKKLRFNFNPCHFPTAKNYCYG